MLLLFSILLFLDWSSNFNPLANDATAAGSFSIMDILMQTGSIEEIFYD